MSWGLFLGAAIGPLVKRAAIALGVGAIVYTGFSVLQDDVASAVTGMWGGLAADTYAVLALAGFVDALGVWLGAMGTVVTLVTVRQLGLVQS